MRESSMTKKRSTEAQTNRFIYVFSGIICTAIAIYTISSDVMAGRYPHSIMLLALGLNQLMFAYLAPHLFPKDERSKTIIYKAMFINYFVLFATILVLISFNFSFIGFVLTSFQTVIVIGSVITISLPITMIIYAKII